MKRVLVLGGYGLIGREVMRTLASAGMAPVGFGRDAGKGRLLAPDAPWIAGDMAAMVEPGAWTAALSGVDAVVNCAGALQEGSRDSLAALHDLAVVALLEACRRSGVKQILQVSAPGAAPDSRLAFLSTKAAGDAAVRASGLDWTVLKPGLVIGTGSYGGTTLLRMLAAFPVVQPVVLANAKIQTVAAADVADAVRAVLAGEIVSRRDYDLVEDQAHELADVLKAMRRWAGREDALWTWRFPRWAGYGIARVADAAGWLDWRSPLRTTALRALEIGVSGDAAPWRDAGGRRLMSLEETLASLPATMQERVFGRAQLVFPVLVMTLAAFWIVSGLLGAWRGAEAVAVLGGAVSPQLAQWLVLGGAVADVSIGWGLLLRKWTRFAAWASIVVSCGYLAMGTWLTPDLWLDPLGPFVKVFPAMALALAVAALAEER